MNDKRTFPDRREHRPIDLAHVENRNALAAGIDLDEANVGAMRIEARPVCMLLRFFERRYFRLGETKRLGAPELFECSLTASGRRKVGPDAGETGTFAGDRRRLKVERDEAIARVSQDFGDEHRRMGIVGRVGRSNVEVSEAVRSCSLRGSGHDRAFWFMACRRRHERGGRFGAVGGRREAEHLPAQGPPFSGFDPAHPAHSA